MENTNIFKFRAYDPMLKKMCYFDLLEYMSMNEMAQDDIVTMEARHNGVQQCTGMKDKNDKLIYVGDILRIVRHYENKRGPKPKDNNVPYYAEVVFENFAYRIKHPKMNWTMLIGGEDDVEIIGNMSESSELLPC